MFRQIATELQTKGLVQKNAGLTLIHFRRCFTSFFVSVESEACTPSSHNLHVDLPLIVCTIALLIYYYGWLTFQLKLPMCLGDNDFSRELGTRQLSPLKAGKTAKNKNQIEIGYYGQEINCPNLVSINWAIYDHSECFGLLFDCFGGFL